MPEASGERDDSSRNECMDLSERRRYPEPPPLTGSPEFETTTCGSSSPLGSCDLRPKENDSIHQCPQETWAFQNVRAGLGRINRRLHSQGLEKTGGVPDIANS